MAKFIYKDYIKGMCVEAFVPMVMITNGAIFHPNHSILFIILKFVDFLFNILRVRPISIINPINYMVILESIVLVVICVQ